MKQEINFSANLVAIAAVLAAHGIHQVASFYSGSGDSGDEFRQTAYDADGEEVSLPRVEVVCEQRDYRQVNGEYGYAVEAKPMDLNSAIEDATNQAISLAGHDGWENNEGGKGLLTIYASGFAELVHTNYFEGEEDRQTYEFGADSVFGESLAAMAAVLKAHECALVEGEYTGSGDSGDGFDISYYGPDNAPTVDQIDDEVSYLVLERTYKNGVFGHEKSTRTADFEQAVEDLCFAMVSAAGHDGWENNEGGGGKVTITAEGTATLEHYNNCEDESTDAGFTWNDELRQDNDEPFEEA